MSIGWDSESECILQSAVACTKVWACKCDSTDRIILCVFPVLFFISPFVLDHWYDHIRSCVYAYPPRVPCMAVYSILNFFLSFAWVCERAFIKSLASKQSRDTYYLYSRCVLISDSNLNALLSQLTHVRFSQRPFRALSSIAGQKLCNLTRCTPRALNIYSLCTTVT